MKHYKMSKQEIKELVKRCQPIGDIDHNIDVYLDGKTPIENQDNKQVVVKAMDELAYRLFDETDEDYGVVIRQEATKLLAKLLPLDRDEVELAVASESSYNPERTDRMVDKILQLISQQQTLDRDNIDIVVEELRNLYGEGEDCDNCKEHGACGEWCYYLFATKLLSKLSPLDRNKAKKLFYSLFTHDWEPYWHGGKVNMKSVDFFFNEILQFTSQQQPDKQDKVIAEGEVENMLCYECNEGYMVGGKTTDEIFRDYCGSEIKLSIKKTKGILD